MSTEPRDVGSVLAELVGQLVEPLRAALRAAVAQELHQLRRHVAGAARPVCVTPDQACELFGFSRAVFDRWLADPHEGLEERPEPVVIRPTASSGGKKVLVHVERMQRWLDARAAAKPRLVPRS
jgi:uncharacterized protein (DUF2384 family)